MDRMDLCLPEGATRETTSTFQGLVLRSQLKMISIRWISNAAETEKTTCVL